MSGPYTTQDGVLRDQRFEVRLTVEERERWQMAARERGLSLAEFVRCAVDESAAEWLSVEPELLADLRGGNDSQD